MTRFERVLVLRWFRRKPKGPTLFQKCLAVHIAAATSALR